MIMEKAVCTLGLITLHDKKIKSNNYQFLYEEEEEEEEEEFY